MAYNWLTNSGIIVADTPQVLQEVTDEFKAAFGDDLVTSADSPAGVLITAETIARTNTAETLAEVANQINPNIAGGIFLDSLCALMGLQRIKATSTKVTATLSGVAGTLIPAGSKAKSKSGDIFMLASPVTLEANGEGEGVFYAEVKGAIVCRADELDTIETPVLGWENVTNPHDGEVGQNEQGDEALRELRRVTLARQGRSTVEAITSHLYELPDVRSLSFRENVESIEKEIDGILLKPHSIYVCVDGGSDTDIARVLLENKTLGAGYNGDVEVEVLEPISGQLYPVTFARPEEINIWVKVWLRDVRFSGDIRQYVAEQVLAYANSTDKYDGFKVGRAVSPFELASALAVSNAFFVVDCQARTDNGRLGRENIPIKISQVARTYAPFIEVVVE